MEDLSERAQIGELAGVPMEGGLSIFRSISRLSIDLIRLLIILSITPRGARPSARARAAARVVHGACGCLACAAGWRTPARLSVRPNGTLHACADGLLRRQRKTDGHAEHAGEAGKGGMIPEGSKSLKLES